VAKLQLPYVLQNRTPADAAPVEGNFDRIQQHTNSDLIERGGTVAMGAQLRLVGNPVNDLDAAPKQYIDAVLPIGIVMMWGGVAAPPGGIWLLCDGSQYEAALWPKLFAVIGNRFGGSGGFFTTPALTNRMPVGAGGTYAAGAQGGSTDSTLPSHSHTINHGHGTTTGDSPSHVHAVPDHYHHQISATAAAVGDHNHNARLPSSQGFVVSGVGPSAGIGEGGGYALTAFTGDAGGHAHSVSGNTNWASQTMGAQATGGISVNHTHGVYDFNGNAGTTGVAPAGTNMPPYLAMTFLMRAA
jgi:microcystin-dependent protein